MITKIANSPYQTRGSLKKNQGVQNAQKPCQPQFKSNPQALVLKRLAEDLRIQTVKPKFLATENGVHYFEVLGAHHEDPIRGIIEHTPSKTFTFYKPNDEAHSTITVDLSDPSSIPENVGEILTHLTTY